MAKCNQLTSLRFKGLTRTNVWSVKLKRQHSDYNCSPSSCIENN